MKGKKGAETTIGTIVTIILAVIVLVFVIAGFTMGWNNLMGKIQSFFGAGGQSIDAAVFSCNAKCSVTQQAHDYCCETFKVKGLDSSDLKAVSETTCKELKTKFPTAVTCDESFCDVYPTC